MADSDVVAVAALVSGLVSLLGVLVSGFVSIAGTRLSASYQRQTELVKLDYESFREFNQKIWKITRRLVDIDRLGRPVAAPSSEQSEDVAELWKHIDLLVDRRAYQALTSYVERAYRLALLRQAPVQQVEEAKLEMEFRSAHWSLIGHIARSKRSLR